MAQFDKFLAYKIKHCIEKGVEVDESLLKSLKNEFNVIKTRKAINESKEIEKQIQKEFEEAEAAAIKQELAEKAKKDAKEKNNLDFKHDK